MWYIGSKRNLARFILPYIKKGLEIFPNGKYIEPFVGGCNMIDKVKHHTKIGYDANRYLIALLKQAQRDPESIRNAYINCRKDYHYVRKHKDEFQDWYVALVGLMATYSCNFLGAYIIEQEPDRMQRASNALLKQDLSGIYFANLDYRDIPIGKGDVYYLDPPYRIRDHYKMPFNHNEFYDWVKFLSRDNFVIISEYYMPPEFRCFWEKAVTANIKVGCSVQRVEKLFIYIA
jgi:DNA adenine methylase